MSEMGDTRDTMCDDENFARWLQNELDHGIDHPNPTEDFIRFTQRVSHQESGAAGEPVEEMVDTLTVDDDDSSSDDSDDSAYGAMQTQSNFVEQMRACGRGIQNSCSLSSAETALGRVSPSALSTRVPIQFT